MAERRPMGALEAEVLDVLWHADGPVTPADVRTAMGTDLAYTTVMTILVRLWEKGLAERTKQGRAYAYAAIVSESDLAATRMRAALAGASDRTATMSRFVDGLDKREAAALRALLGEADG
jgi:predicted transcriptional regulator